MLNDFSSKYVSLGENKLHLDSGISVAISKWQNNGQLSTIRTRRFYQRNNFDGSLFYFTKSAVLLHLKLAVFSCSSTFLCQKYFEIFNIRDISNLTPFSNTYFLLAKLVHHCLAGEF